MSTAYNAGGAFASELGNTNDAVPHAYLNMIVFDGYLNYDTSTPPQAITFTNPTANTQLPISFSNVTVTKPGYAYIWVSVNGASSNFVYFDDLQVSQLHSPYVAGGDFYPFGLTMDDRQIKSERYRFGYQGQFSEYDSLTKTNQFQLRLYDPRFGRWLSPDPKKQYFSSYIGIGNNPVGGVDPAGGLFEEITKLAEVTVMASRLPSVGAVIGKTLTMAAGAVAIARCPRCPDPNVYSDFREGALWDEFDPKTNEHVARYQLDNLKNGKDGWSRIWQKDGSNVLKEVTVKPDVNPIYAYFADKLNPILDVGTTVVASTGNGLSQYFGGHKDYFHSLKVDGEGFYRNKDLNGRNLTNVDSSERYWELGKNTISTNAFFVEMAVPDFFISTNKYIDAVGNEILKSGIGDVIENSVTNALRVH